MMAAGHTIMGGVVVIKGFGSIFYIRNVVGNDTYSIYTRMGGGIHRTRRYVLGDVQSEERFIQKPDICRFS